MSEKPNYSVITWAEGANRHFSNYRPKSAWKDSASLLSREAQVKTMRERRPLARKAIVRKATSNERLRGCGGKGALPHCSRGYKWVQPQRRMVWRFLRKLEIELSYDPAIPLWGILTGENDNLKSRVRPMFTAALLTAARRADNLSARQHARAQHAGCSCFRPPPTKPSAFDFLLCPCPGSSTSAQ